MQSLSNINHFTPLHHSRMPTPSQVSDHTGITQPLNEIIAAVRAADSHQREIMAARIAEVYTLSLQTHEQVAAAATSKTSVSPEPVTLPREELLDLLTTQYDMNHAAWRAAFELDKKDLETLAKKDTVMRWAATLPLKTITALSAYGQPLLKLLPSIPVPQLIEVLNQHKKIPGQKDSKIWWNQWNTIIAPSGSFGLTTDIEDMPFDPNIYYVNPTDQNTKRTNEQMVAEYDRQFTLHGIGSMPQDAYLPSAMDAMARGQVYDKRYRTAFNRPQGTGSMPNADWDDDRVYLGGFNTDVANGNLRCRPWVRGERV